jgi:hypothetical protein
MSSAYQRKLTRENPGLIVLLLDGSLSMDDPWSTSGNTIAEGAAFALNRTLRDLALNACYNAEDGTRNYMNVAVFTYGTELGDGQGVEWTFGNLSQPSRGYAVATEWVPAYIRQKKTDSGSLPIWLEPHAVGWTPMCKAFNQAAEVVQQHVADFPEAFPPIVLNITDGMPTDHQDDWNLFERAAKAITSHKTGDGQALLFNIHIDGTGQENTVLFPDHPPQHSTYAEHLARISSTLPANMVRLANDKLGLGITEAALGYCLNADMQQLSAFLQIGTYVVPTPTVHDGYADAPGQALVE